MIREYDSNFAIGLVMGLALAYIGMMGMSLFYEQPLVTDEMYESYATLELHRNWRDGTNLYITPDIEPIQKLAAKHSTPDQAEAFVLSIPYKTDMDLHGQIEYWAFPAETLYLNGGDCEDRAFLFVSIVRAQGHDARCVDDIFNNHMYAEVRMDSSSPWVEYLR